jgi:hypothetical protein
MFLQQKIGAGQFGTFATISAHSGPEHSQRFVRCWWKLTLGRWMAIRVLTHLGNKQPILL